MFRCLSFYTVIGKAVNETFRLYGYTSFVSFGGVITKSLAGTAGFKHAVDLQECQT